MGVAAVVDRIRAVVGETRAYLSFDIDTLDPAYAPGTGTPEVGGLATWQAQAVLRGAHFVGMDVVEVAPAYDHAEITALAAATVVWSIWRWWGGGREPDGRVMVRVDSRRVHRRSFLS